jgi:GrpB-like predicted nucleotidyltransferase (UPF0157 family)
MTLEAIGPFDESAAQRKILPYDPVYEVLFSRIRRYVEDRIATTRLYHIGSTAIPDLRGKPMLDIVAVTTRTNLRDAQRELEAIGFRRRDVWVDRDDKPYVCGSIEARGRGYNVNIHICHRDDPVHSDSLTFLEILRRRPDLRRRYEDAKDRAHAIDAVSAEVYNREKEAVIRAIHREAQ